jgi:aryl-alcohol dehydrogenase-like predicted oxidoreductase
MGYAAAHALRRHSRSEHIRQVVDAMLTRLKVATIDVLYQHRLTRTFPSRTLRHREGTDSARQGEEVLKLTNR